jgi:predicted metal-dependent phosphoesterase TrpH
MIDLHIHTKYSSDGQYPPLEIIEMAKAKGIKTIAISDHNTVEGIPEAIIAASKYNIDLIPSIEINTYFNSLDLHVLGYFIDYNDKTLQHWLMDIHQQKIIQSEARGEALKNIGLFIDDNLLQKYSQGRIPTGYSFLSALLNDPRNNSKTILDPYRPEGSRADSPYYNFYEDIFKPGCPAYVGLPGLETPYVIAMLKSLNGVPVLAHPKNTPENIVRELIPSGLMGLEVYYTKHSQIVTKKWFEFSERHNLLMTAGSDFHGEKIKPDIKLGELTVHNEDNIISMLKEASAYLT